MRGRLRDGDEAAFAELFDEHGRSVYNHALRLCGDWATAEDVMSITYLEAWRRRRRIDADGGSLRPWLLGIATNIVRNHRRAARRYARALARMPEADAEPDFAEQLVQRMADAERAEAARKAFHRLPRHEQDVFSLCVWAGLDYAETAAALGIAVGTVKSRLSRARKRLEPLAPPGQVKGERENAIRLQGEEETS